MRDRLFILKSGFHDPAYPEETFYCWHCVLIEGLLVSFPDMAQQIDVERISWARPRNEVVQLLGPDNQSLPVLVFANDPPEGIAVQTHNGLAFTADKDTILKALSLKYGIPAPHP